MIEILAPDVPKSKPTKRCCNEYADAELRPNKATVVFMICQEGRYATSSERSDTLHDQQRLVEDQGLWHFVHVVVCNPD